MRLGGRGLGRARRHRLRALRPALGRVDDAGYVWVTGRMKEMIAERTESQPGKMGGFFKMNPKVDDIPDQFSRNINGIKLIGLLPLPLLSALWCQW